MNDFHIGQSALDTVAFVKAQTPNAGQQMTMLLEAMISIAAEAGKTQDFTAKWAEMAIGLYPGWGQPIIGRTAVAA